MSGAYTGSGDGQRRGFRTLKYVCFVSRTEFELKGSPGARGMALGDVDGDGDVELCVGSVNGTLSVYKYANSKPWSVVNGLGTVLCVDVVHLSADDTRIVVLSAEGWCRLLTTLQSGVTTPAGSHRLPRNITNMQFTNITPSSHAKSHTTHVILGGLDRTVYLYGLNKSEDYAFTLLAVYRVDFAVTSLAVYKGKDDTSVLVGLSNSSYAVINLWRTSKGAVFDWTGGEVSYYYAESDTDVIRVVPSSGGVERSYVTCDGKKMAVATQDGVVTWMSVEAAIGGPTTLFPKSPDLTSHPLSAALEIFSPHTPTVSSWVAPIYINEMLMNGISFMYCDRVPHLCLCTWSGDVYIVDGNKDAVRFSMHEPIRTFLQGNYSLSPGELKSCIFCSTFEGHIVMFTDIENEVSTVKNSRVTDSIDETDEELEYKLPTHPDADLRHRRDTAKRIRSILYDITPNDIARLEAYKSILEARLSAQPHTDTA